MITLLVGSQEHACPFQVSKSIIRKASPALSEEIAQGDPGPIHLPDTDSDVFWVFLHWAYKGDLQIGSLASPSFPGEPSCLKLCQLWALAYDLQCRELCNRVIDEFLRALDAELSGFRLGVFVLLQVLEIPPEESTLRRLIEDLHLAKYVFHMILPFFFVRATD